jgi:hypothetical protein
MLEPAKYLKSWTRRTVANGLALVAPEGVEAGTLRLHLRQPLRPFRELVAEACAEPWCAPFAVEVGPLQRLTTFEGEHAGLVTLQVRGDGFHAERSLCLIAGDEWGHVLDVASTVPARFAPMRDLARGLTEVTALRLGERRRRRYEFTPPPGWTAVARPQSVLFLRPGYPRVASLIEVRHAHPHDWDAARAEPLGVISDLPDPRPRGPALRTIRVSVRDVIQGPVREWEPAVPGGAGGVHIAADLVDRRFEYHLSLLSHEPDVTAARRAFLAVLYSIMPVPAPRDSYEPIAPFAGWME